MKIRLYNIFGDVMKCFVSACGTTLVIFFFGYGNLDFTKENARLLVFCLFIFYLIIVFMYGFFFGRGRWYRVALDSSEQPVLEPFPMLEKIVRTESESTCSYADDFMKEYSHKVIAIHEAGHAVMSYLNTEKITDFEAALSLLEPGKHSLYNFADKDRIRAIIGVYYAGAAAEEILLGHCCSCNALGEDSDFAKASQFIKAYIVMTDSEVSKSLLDKELSKRLIRLSMDFYASTKELLINNRELVEKLSVSLENLLSDKGGIEKIEKADVMRLLNNIKATE